MPLQPESPTDLPTLRVPYRTVPERRPPQQYPQACPHRRRGRSGACFAVAGLLLAHSVPALAQRSPADVPEPSTYLHLLSTASIGESIRFNNPFRLEHQLGDTGESLSRTPLYANLGFGLTLGDPEGLQHGLALQWNRSLSGLPQHVVTPAYLLMLDGGRPWLWFARAGVPIILNPDPNAGGELSIGGAYLLTAGIGVQAELVGNVFYGAATWEKKVTTIPMLSLQAGLIVDYEVLP